MFRKYFSLRGTDLLAINNCWPLKMIILQVHGTNFYINNKLMVFFKCDS